VVPSDDGIGIPTERLCAAIDERTLIVPLSHVLFRSAFVQDIAAITRRAHEVGALVCADLYQSLGTVPVSVREWGVDFACGGSVKWLCGGPGAGYLYVRPDLLPRLEPRVTGWFGHAAPFAFRMPAQEYAATTWRMLGGTPAVAPLYHARPGAELVGAIGVDAIRAKSQRQTARIVEAVDAAGWMLRSPRSGQQRGGSVCFDLPGAAAVCEELNRRKFFCDHRPGAGIRISPHFYTIDDEIDAFFSETRTLAARHRNI
jgi:kynureninase